MESQKQKPLKRCVISFDKTIEADPASIGQCLGVYCTVSIRFPVVQNGAPDKASVLAVFATPGVWGIDVETDPSEIENTYQDEKLLAQMMLNTLIAKGYEVA